MYILPAIPKRTTMLGCIPFICLMLQTTEQTMKLIIRNYLLKQVHLTKMKMFYTDQIII